jgi:hypothetical protein
LGRRRRVSEFSKPATNMGGREREGLKEEVFDPGLGEDGSRV